MDIGQAYKIAIIDDQPIESKEIFDTIQLYLNEIYNLKIQFEIYNSKAQWDTIHQNAIDIILFDCDLHESDLVRDQEDNSHLGFSLINDFRNTNKRSKIIFYSASFSFEDETSFNFTAVEFIKIINDLNIYKITSRDVKQLSEAIRDAIYDLEPILISIEKMASDYECIGKFKMSGQDYSLREMADQVKLGTDIGNSFRVLVTENILHYLMTFEE